MIDAAVVCVRKTCQGLTMHTGFLASGSRGLRALGNKLESAVMDSIETGHIPTQTGPLDPQAKKIGIS